MVRSFIAVVAGSCMSCAAWAQDMTTTPLEKVVEPKAAQPITANPAPSPDPDAARLIAQLSGTFTSDAVGDSPALLLRSAQVSAAGSEDMVLVEIARADNPGEPFRVILLHPYRRQGQMRLRQFDLVGNPGIKDVLVGVWAAPDAMPKLEPTNLQPVLDMPLSLVGEHFSGRTAQPFPILRDGAIEVVGAISTSEQGIALADAGFDADGRKVWGTALDTPIQFKRAEASVPVTRSPEGLIVITTITPPPDAPRLVPDGEITVHYTGWLTTGQMFDSTHNPGRQPFKLKIPGGVIKGWNEGLKGIAKGERRRLIIPGPLAYGERGARNAIPPNATLIFDVECLHVENPSAQPAPTEPAPAPAQDSTPIGKPPTNAQPEKPR